MAVVKNTWLVGDTFANTDENAHATQTNANTTAIGTPTATPTANTIPLWDANKNLSVVNLLEGFTTTVTSATTVTLTIASNEIQVFTGSTAQLVTLPTTGVPAGMDLTIINMSSAAVTVQSSGANTICVIPGAAAAPFAAVVFTSLVATPTTAANWNWQSAGAMVASGKLFVVSNSLTLAGTDGTVMTFPGASDTVVTLAATQTLTNKTLTSPLINLGLIPLTNNAVPIGSTTVGFLNLYLSNGATNITQLLSGATNNPQTLTLPATATSDTLVGRASTDTLTNKTLTSPTVNGYTETVQALGTVGASKTIPALSAGTVMTALLTAATTTVFTMPTAAPGQSFVLAVTQAATPTGNATFTGVVWPGGVTPVISTTANAVDVFTFFCTTGTTWRGSYQQGYAS